MHLNIQSNLNWFSIWQLETIISNNVVFRTSSSEQKLVFPWNLSVSRMTARPILVCEIVLQCHLFRASTLFPFCIHTPCLWATDRQISNEKLNIWSMTCRNPSVRPSTALLMHIKFDEFPTPSESLLESREIFEILSGFPSSIMLIIRVRLQLAVEFWWRLRYNSSFTGNKQKIWQ